MHARSLPARFISVLLAFAFSFSAVPLAATSPAPAAAVEPEQVAPLKFGPQSVRVQGVDRLATSVAISQEGWDSSEWVVIATARNFPDALVAGPLAAALEAPVLLSECDALPTDVAAEIDRLGASRAIVVGGVGVLSQGVIDDLVSAGIPAAGIERIGGADRYGTSRLVAERLDRIVGDIQSAALATGYNYPDALSVSGFVGANGVPILLTAPTQLSPDAKRAFDDLGILSTLVVGGEGAISAEVATLAPHPTRVGGVDRYDTARKLAEYAFAYGFTYETVIVAVGTSFPDALCAGPYAAMLGAPLVLTRSEQLAGPTNEFFNAHCSSIENVVVVGGTGAISDTVVAEIEEAATTELSEDILPLNAAAVSGIETIAPDGSQVVFPSSSPVAASLETSAVLMSGPSAIAPSGMLLRVLDVQESGGKITVETTQATLADVIIKGSLDVTGTLDPNAQGGTATDIVVAEGTAVDDSHIDVTFDEVERSAGTPTEVLPPEGPAGGSEASEVGEQSAMTVPAAGTSPEAVMGGTVTIPFEADIAVGGQDRAVNPHLSRALKTQGQISFTGQFTVNASWGYLYWQSTWWGGYPVHGLQNITLQTYLAESFEIQLAYEQSATLTLDIIKMIEDRINKQIRLHVGTNITWIGPVPVITEFFLAPVVELSGNVGGKLAIDFKQSSSITFGIRYDWWRGWSPIRGASNRFEFGLTGGAVAGLNVAIGAKLDCLLYGLTGPYFGVTGNLGFEADTTADPWWNASVAVKGIYGGSLSLFGKATSWGSSVTFWKRKIVQAAGPFPNGGVVWWPAAEVAGVSPSLKATDAKILELIEVQETTPMTALSSAIDPDTLQASDFQVPGLDVLDAQILPDGKTVRLTTSAQDKGGLYMVLIGHESFRTLDDAWASASGMPLVGYYPITVTRAASNADDQVTVVLDSYSRLVTDTVQPGDFSVTGLTVTTATLQDDGQTVVLDTSVMPPGLRLDVDVAAGGVEDGLFASEASGDTFTSYVDYTVSAGNVNQSASVVAMESPDGVNVYATGMGGWVRKSTNGGVSWSNAGRILPSVAMNTGVGNTYDLAFPNGDASTIVGVTYLGVIPRSTNGAASWGYFDNNAVTTSHNDGVDFSAPDYGIVVDWNMILESTNGGVTWVRHAQNGTGVGGTGVRFAPSDRSRGYISSIDGIVYRTDDGGHNWVECADTGTTEILNEVEVSPVNPDVAVVVGNAGTLLVTHDGGDSWSETDTGLATVGLTEIDWADEHVVFIAGQEKVIMVSRDSGRTWSTVQVRVPGGAYVGAIWARDPLNVWAAGLTTNDWKITGN